MVVFDDEEFTSEIGSVDEYIFEDKDEYLVSLSEVPVIFDEACIPDSSNEKVFLRGITDGGLQPVYQEIVGWKLASGYYKAKIMILTKEGKWITLLKPKKGYLKEERSTMITVELLHFLLKRPNSSEQSLWDHLRKLFSNFSVAPSKEDIKDHLLIKLFIQRNQTLATSPVLHELLNEKSRSSYIKDELKDKIFAGDDEVDESDKSTNGDDSTNGNSPDSDSFCAICDDGGDLVCCEGRCFRSFHATKATGKPSNCASLGLTEEFVKATPKFICKNCKYEQHQCFVCGKLGSSNSLKGAEVYACGSHACGHFYHPKCIASYVFWDSKAEAFDYEKQIEKGKPFVCPLHKCAICKKVENKKVKGYQLAICRRCPIAYHKICIPRKIIIEDKSATKRIWDDPKFDRIVLYCLKHSIDEELGTPVTDHIVFPVDFGKERIASVQKITGMEEKKKRKITFSGDLKNPKRSCKRILDSPDKKKAAVVPNYMIKTEVKKNGHHVSGDSHADGANAKPVKIDEKRTPGAENEHDGEEAPILSKKQNGKTFRSPRSNAKTRKRYNTPVKMFNINRRITMQSVISRPMYKTNKHNKVAHNSSTYLEDLNRNSMMPPTNIRQTGKNIGQVKVIRMASQVIDGGLAGERADNCTENVKMTNFQNSSSVKRDNTNASERQQLASCDEPSSLPLFIVLKQFAKPWSCVEENIDMHGQSDMHPYLKCFALGPDKSARLLQTSCGWLDD